MGLYVASAALRLVGGSEQLPAAETGQRSNLGTSRDAHRAGLQFRILPKGSSAALVSRLAARFVVAKRDERRACGVPSSARA